LLLDDKPFLKKWWFVTQPVKNSETGLPGMIYVPKLKLEPKNHPIEII